SWAVLFEIIGEDKDKREIEITLLNSGSEPNDEEDRHIFNALMLVLFSSTLHHDSTESQADMHGLIA
ncbi:MAG TPA: hypothetical protein VF144_09260, partial [Chitinophagaceae bacterium]